jgi:hypothetical protein
LEGLLLINVNLDVCLKKLNVSQDTLQLFPEGFDQLFVRSDLIQVILNLELQLLDLFCKATLIYPQLIDCIIQIHLVLLTVVDPLV